MSRRITVQPMEGRQLGLEEPMSFRLKTRGDVVEDLEVIPGMAHRGIEELALRRNLLQNLTLLERFCSLCSNSHPSTFCMAVEAIAGIAVPPRAEHLRVVADELKRITSHLFNVGVLAHLAGFEPEFRRAMEAREIVQDAQETVYGNRMDLAANRLGGVRRDLAPEQARWLAGELDRLEGPLAALHAFLHDDRQLRRRVEGLGVLPRAEAVRFGLVGPVARASGVAHDVRAQAPYAAYDTIGVQVQTEEAGDVRARALVRVREAQEAVRLVRRCLAAMPEGPIHPEVLPEIGAGEVLARSEAPRGELLYDLRLDGGELPARLACRVPSLMNWSALPGMVRGSRLRDVPLIVNSIDPCVSCTDR